MATTQSGPLTLTDIRRVLATTPGVLRGLIAAAPARALEFRETPDAWTPRQVLCHVTDGEVTDWMPRLELILSAGETRPFAPFDREAGFLVYEGWSADDLLAEFERLRTENLSRLDGFRLGATDLARLGRHPEFGTVTLAQLVACWATHDLAHIAQIARALVRFVGPHVGPWRQYFSLLSDQRGS